MKIESERMLPGINPYKNESVGRSETAVRNDTAAKAGEAVRSGGDRVNISISSEDIARLNEASAAQSDDRAQRIASLKAQVENGTYSVDPVKVAKKILEKLHGPDSGAGGVSTE